MASALTNLLNNPLLVAIGSVLFIVAGFFLRSWLMPWLQKAKDAATQKEIEKQSKKSQDENQDMNDQVDDIFNGPTGPR